MLKLDKFLMKYSNYLLKKQTARIAEASEKPKEKQFCSWETRMM